MKRIFLTATCLATSFAMAFCASLATASTADFDDLSLPSAESYWNGSDNSGGFVSGGVTFNNTFTDWGGGIISWAGFAYSNISDTTTPGYDNQYSAYPGTGCGDGDDIYGVGFCDYYFSTMPCLEVGSGTDIQSIRVTNTTFAALSMRDGDIYAKKFGGDDGTDEDWFLLTITGINSSGSVGSVDFYLADYRFADGADDYIVDEWTEVDLSPLAGATSLTFALTSSDVGTGGMNTPAYFAIDNIQMVPEPGALCLLTLLVTGMGALFGRRRK
jgi:hypothetical protein